VSITGKEDAKFNSKSTLTTWGDDPIEALYLAIFKAGVVFSWGIWKTKNQSRRG
jgi:Leu/Phe-tRNA-protein transferase